MEADALIPPVDATHQPKTSEAKSVARNVLEGFILKRGARQWGNTSNRATNELAEAAK
jgi:hypothetical protein